MEEQVKQLVDRTWAKFQTLPPTNRLLIAISGIPGSGKTTLAATVSSNLNTLHSQSHPSSPPISAVIPMDGYHLTRSQLSALPNAEEAIFRRGAAFTFDSSSYLSLIRSLRAPLPSPSPSPTSSNKEEERMIYAPSFSHSLKDPIENDISIPSSSRILFIEGLYLSLSSPTPSSQTKESYTLPSPPHSEEWSQAGDLMDEHWFISTSYETAAKRLIKRHLESGVSENEEEAKTRVWESDMRNGKEIVENRRMFREGIDVVIESCDDKGWT